MTVERDAAGWDVIVAGSGNAGISAALAARDAGATVLVVDAAPSEWAGGNSYFTAGAFRVAFEHLDDLRSIVEISDADAARIDLEPYGRDAYLADLERITLGRTDPVLGRILADESLDAARWLAERGVRWELLAARQSHEVDGRIRFFGNLVLGASGGGEGLMGTELAAAERAGIDFAWQTSLVAIDAPEAPGRDVVLTIADSAGRRRQLRTGAVVVASGGFEADIRRRAGYLGPGWDIVKVRGTPFNTGDGLFACLDAGGAPIGHWSGCHAIAWDAAAPDHGDRTLTNRLSRQAYPYGVVVNANGQRFIDEGADFRNYTYARYGAEIMRQPGARAFQLFDATTLPLVSSVDYDTATESRFEAATIPELAGAIGVPGEALQATVDAYNAGITDDAFDPSRRDGKRTTGIAPPKSNWAQRLETSPFVAFAVTCGITFTFGGVRIDPAGRVLRSIGEPLPGVHACGELVGGLFYHNYPGGAGLSSGTVFGRRAGAAAADYARSR